MAAPYDGYTDNGYWYDADGTEIGPIIWGSFAIIQQVEKDTCTGLHGAQYISPIGPGFGQFHLCRSLVTLRIGVTSDFLNYIKVMLRLTIILQPIQLSLQDESIICS